MVCVLVLCVCVCVCPSACHLEVHDDGLHQQEDGGVVLPVDVGGGFTQLHTGDGGALHQLLTAALTRQRLPEAVQEQLLHTHTQRYTHTHVRKE